MAVSSIVLGSAGTLTSLNVTATPVIDGMQDAVWNQANCHDGECSWWS